MKKLLLLLTMFFTLTVVHGQLYPVQNLDYSQSYIYPDWGYCPSYNCFDLSWTEPDTNTIDTLIGYNIYKNGIFYKFLTETYFACSGMITMPGCSQTTPDWYNNMPFYATVKAVYNKDSAISVVDDSVFVEDIWVGVNDINERGKITIYPNPFFIQTILVTDNYYRDATLTIYNIYGQSIKQIVNFTGQSITLNRDNLQSGLYFISLTQDNKIVTIEKLIIIDE